ncbi:DNA primase small subunit domain-containing protein [Stetteria hydrogenophila]
MYRRGSSRRSALVRVTSRTRLKDLYQAYYSLRPSILLPQDFGRREFAFQLWEGDAYVRHLSFESVEDVAGYLAEKAPRQAYYSVAVYQLPEAPSMEEKGWLGSDLMFDIDADHLPGCEGATVSDECLEKAGREAGRLLRMLERDLGVKGEAFFTGHRGFHVIASCGWCSSLGARERRLIANYVAGRGVDLSRLFPRPRRGFDAAAPSPEDPGWRGWLARALRSRGGEPLRSLGGLEALERLLEEVAVHVDAQVTQDVSRLERIPFTLNGKASMLAVPVENPEGFKPTASLSPFHGEVTVKALADVDTRLMGARVALRRGEEADIPAHVGVALASMGLLALVGGEVVVRKSTGWGSI